MSQGIAAGSEGDGGEISGRQSLRQTIHLRHHVVPPAHHIVSNKSTLLDYVPYITASAPEVLYNTGKSSVLVGRRQNEDTAAKSSLLKSTDSIRTGFRNPWPSWHKPEVGEYWHGMHWRKRSDKQNSPQQTEQGETSSDDSMEQSLLSEQGNSNNADLSNGNEQHDDDLQLEEPEFDKIKSGIVQATWLGHATVLLQLPSLKSTSRKRPLRILFDPIFSMRCSPTQLFGPTRSYPPPCPISFLPEIDLVVISHSHYDHLDYDSIVQLWKAHQEYIRFVVPLGNREWFLSLGIGIGEDRVTELDWWDEVWLDQTSNDDNQPIDEKDMLRVICTPAQHGSGRYGIDASRSLWSSWTLEYISQGQIYRIFFGGDTGFQFHSSVPEVSSTYPVCPAFAEVTTYIGKPDLSFLPISVGASMNFVKSYDRFGLVPEMDEGLTAANHMTPQDAVRVAKIMRGAEEKDDQTSSQLVGNGKVVAIHWGTFVTGPEEVKNSMHELEIACKDLGVSYVRNLDERQDFIKTTSLQPDSNLIFACLNHGQSVYLAMKSSG